MCFHPDDSGSTASDMEAVRLWKILQWALEAADTGPHKELEAIDLENDNATPELGGGGVAIETTEVLGSEQHLQTV